MPKFPDLLLNNNPNAPSVDLNDLQIKGVGIFADKAARDLLDANIQTEGYLAIMQQILVAQQAYLEAELERAVFNVLCPRHQEKNELYTNDIAHFELLGRELGQQLSPGPPSGRED